MRAWYYARFGGPEVVQFGDVPEPEIQDSHDIIVHVHAAALNPIDYKRRQGALKRIISEHWPQVIGYDVSGVVASCGASVTKFRVGDEVFALLPNDRAGALAERVAAHEQYFAKKPSNLSHTEAAALPLVSLTALSAFRQGQLTKGKKVLITAGSGGVGSVAIQIAKNVFQASTVATTGSAKKSEKLKQLGADRVVDYTREEFDRVLAEYDFALDCKGEAKRCIDCITRGGSVISIAETPSHDALRGKESAGIQVSRTVGMLLDCLSYPVARKARAAQVNYESFFVVGDGNVLQEVKEMCEANTVVPVIDRVFTFEKADSAMVYLEAGHATGKVVVKLVESAEQKPQHSAL